MYKHLYVVRKCLTCLLIIVLSYSKGIAQESQQNFSGIQIGLFRADLYYEFNLSNSISLKSSAGTYFSMYNSNFYAVPYFEIQPKWNYNKAKRAENNKDVKNNAANYLSLNFNYTTNWSSLKNHKSEDLNRIIITPTYGLKRNFGRSFNYEIFMGLEYRKAITSDTHSEFGIGFGAQLGYYF